MRQINVFKQMKKITCFLIGMFAMFLWSCEEVKDWHDPTDSVPPGALSNVTVKNINGGAWIYYSLPSDNDLLGVRAEYAFEEGEEIRSVFSSAFNDSILIEGYVSTNEHPVTLYVIDKSRNESLPVQTTIKPEVPPVELIRNSMKLYTTFGGIYSEWTNESETDVAIGVYIKDSIGDYVLHDIYYTKAINGTYTFRNMISEEQDFRVEIRDKWEHYATPLDTVMKPLFEEEIYGRDPVTLVGIWQRFGANDGTCIYRGDISRANIESGRDFWLIYDGVTFQNSTWWVSASDYPYFPYYFTIDMGRKASYSRLKYWMRSRSPYYSATIIASFELWGTNDPKAINTIGDGSQEDNLKYWTQWPEVGGTDECKNDWVKLADCIIQFPSGADPYTVSSSSILTQEDKDFIAEGFGFDIDPTRTSEAFKYLRFVVRATNAGGDTNAQITELKFWGAYAE
jgi:hypothetical protein